jgi:rhamnosyltransferase
LRHKTLGVIVSFNGLSTIQHTLEAVLKNVNKVLIIDNGSNSSYIKYLNDLISSRVTLIEFGENRGIAAALNAGFRFAEQNGYEWILTMDQDSILDEGFIGAYEDFLDENPAAVFLFPEVWVHNKKPKKLGETTKDYVITSGNLVKTKLINKVGLFNEILFQNNVDFDFCLKVRLCGIKIWHVPNAIMYHQLGEKHKHKGILTTFYTKHNPLSRYYIYRNSCYLINQYFNKFPLFCIRLFCSTILLYVAIWVYEGPKSALKNTKYIYRGVLDFLRNNMGIASNALRNQSD